MQRVSLQVLREGAPRAALILARSGVFDPETVEVSEEMLPDLPGERFRELYLSAKSRLAKIRGGGYCPLDTAADATRVVSLEELERANVYLGDLWHRLSQLEEEERTLDDRRRFLEQLSDSLEKFQALDVDLGVLQQPKSFLALHIGTVPRANQRRLEQAASLAAHFVRPFHTSGELVYVVVAGPAESDQDVQSLLRTADFRVFKVPPEFQDRPEQVRRSLEQQAAEVVRQAAAKDAEIDAVVDAEREQLGEACKALKLAAPYAELATRLRGLGGLAVVEGWIPRDDVAALAEALSRELEHPHVLTTRNPRPDEHARVPSVMRHPRFLRPFVALVTNYGIPRYGEIDPTVLFAVSFIAMFGMMFGDIGHGAVIALGAVFARKRFPIVVPFVVAAGLSSIFFGFMYGSVFGYEPHGLALWMPPLSDPLLMLRVALYWGIGFILVANTLTLLNLLAEQRYEEALFDTRGITGTLLYLAGIYVGFRWMGDGVFGNTELVLILVPLAVVMGFKWRHLEGPLGEKVLVVAVEGFEAVMNYLANTLSFLRVAAFSLNHVALAVAVFTLADMLGTAGHWITVVLGNVFIIVIEGAIVTIQVLRLEYYEGFSRFFRGDGRAFRPLRLEGVTRT
jgi:V/A-type H+-transporting ATPase subunit I